jgi:UDP-glucose 4-epimerase
VASVVVVDNFFLGREANLLQAQGAHGDSLHIYREDAGDRGAMTAICERHRPSVVINMATKALLYSFFNPVGAFEINVEVAANLAELLRAGLFDRLVHVSSSEVYGTARAAVMAEDHPMTPETSYAAGKAAADLLLNSYVRMFDLDIITARPFNNYGPRQNEGTFAAIVPATLRRISHGDSPVIEGDGSQTRDFMYVGDTAESIVRMAAHDGLRGLTLNLGTGRETSILELITTLCEVVGFDGEPEFAPERPADVRRHRADVTRAEQLLGAMPRTDLAVGLQRTYDWYVGASLATS